VKRTPRSLTLHFPGKLRERMDRLVRESGCREARDVVVAALELYEYVVDRRLTVDANFFWQAPGGPLVSLETPTGPLTWDAGSAEDDA